MKLLSALAAASAALLFSGYAQAQDAEAGYQIARQWCSPCHQIGKKPQPNPISPPFADIARMPSTTTISLNAFLSTPHHRMPNYKLTQREIADVSAFILSFRER